MKIPKKLKRDVKKVVKSQKAYKTIPSKKVTWNFDVGELVSVNQRKKTKFGIVLRKYESGDKCQIYVSVEGKCFWISPAKLGKLQDEDKCK